MAASGAVGNGTTDDTAAINTFFAGLTNGTTVYLPAGKFYLINSANLVVPAGIAIVGSGSPLPQNVSGQPTGSGFILNPSYTVLLSDGDTLADLGVWRSGLTVNPTAAQVLAAVSQWGSENSVGITVPPNLGRDLIDNVFVEGFNRGLLLQSGQVTVRDLWGDDYDGLYVDYYPGDRSTFSGIRFEPFYAFGTASTSGSWARPGIAFWLAGTNGGGDLSGLFSFMYANSLVVAGEGWNITNGWFEWDDSAGNGETNAIGIRAIGNGSTNISSVQSSSDFPVSAEAGGQTTFRDVATSQSNSSNPDWFLGGQATSETFTVGGTAAAGNQLSATFTSASVSGSPVTVSYTETAADGTSTAAHALARAINQTQSLAAAHISAVGTSTGSVVTVYADDSVSVTYSAAASGSATLTAASGAGLGGTGGLIAGARQDGIAGSPVFKLTNNVQWWTIAHPYFQKPLPTGWISDAGAGSGTLTLSGVPWSTVTTSNLSGCGTSPNMSPGANDGDGTVTEGTTATGCTMTFTTPFFKAPDCTLSSPTGTLPTGYSTTTTALVITNASGSNDEFIYHCRPNG